MNMMIMIIIIILTAPSLARSPEPASEVSCVCSVTRCWTAVATCRQMLESYSMDTVKIITFELKIFHLLVCGEAAQQEAGPVPHHVLRAALSLGGLSEHDMRSLD